MLSEAEPMSSRSKWSDGNLQKATADGAPLVMQVMPSKRLSIGDPDSFANAHNMRASIDGQGGD